MGNQSISRDRDNMSRTIESAIILAIQGDSGAIAQLQRYLSNPSTAPLVQSALSGKGYSLSNGSLSRTTSSDYGAPKDRGTMGKVQDAAIILSKPVSSAQKAQAVAAIRAHLSANPGDMGQVQQILQQYQHRYNSSNGQVEYKQGDQWVPTNYTAGDGGESGTIDPNQYARTSWRQGVDMMNGARGSEGSSGDGNSIRATSGNPNLVENGGNYNDQDMTWEGGLGGNTTANAGDFGDGKDYSGEWFGGIDPLAIDQMNNVGNAWGYFNAKGNNGKDFYGTGMERYGGDDFNSAMGLASILSPTASGASGGIMSAQDKLKFTGDWMGSSGQGQFKDPGKILQAAFANAAAAPDSFSQEQIITQAMELIQPYVDPSSYNMINNRVMQILNTYAAEGMQPGSTSDSRNGQLLKSVMAAVGM